MISTVSRVHCVSTTYTVDAAAAAAAKIDLVQLGVALC